MMTLYKILLSSLVALQIIGPSWVLAIQTSQASVQEASKSQALIVGIRGVVTVNPGKEGPGYAPKYRAVLAVGDVISTEEESVAEILLENQGLVTIQEYSEAMLAKNADGGLSVALEVGAAEWSIPTKRQGALTFTTPNIRATTHAGLVTAEVQPILGETARAPRLRDSYLILASLYAQSARDVGLLETFCVNEGDLKIEYPGAQQGLWQQEKIAPGECRGFLNGQPRAMASAMGTEYGLVDWRAVCAVGTHCEIPESAKQLIAKKQTAQALALEQALLGTASEECELGGPNKNKQECIIDEQIVLATTGLTNGQLLEGGGPGGGDTGGVILPCTGDPQLCGDSGGSPTPTPIPIPGSPNLTVGGMVPPLTQFFPEGDGFTPTPPLPSNIQTAESLWPVNGMPGGEGLLNFLNSDFTADLELVVVDSGILAGAPHQGKAPQDPLVVSDLSPVGGVIPSNQDVPLDFYSYHQPPLGWYGPAGHRTHDPKVQIGVDSLAPPQLRKDPSKQLRQLAQFARSPLIDPANIFASVVPKSSCELSSASCFEVILESGVEAWDKSDPKVGQEAGIDASIQARSASTDDPTPGDKRLVTLEKGVVLGNTQVSLALQEKTNDSFSGLETTLGQAIQGSAVSILGVPGDPAIVNVEDRVLAILGGSRIQPADPSVTTALLAVLDGRLRGPVAPTVIGKDAAGDDIFREDVPVIEMIGGSAEVTTGVMVGSTANTGQTGDLDQALLEASSPLLAMMQSSMTTSSDFGRVAGQNAKLVATLIPGDALVRLNASSLMINGNLFNVTGGGQLIVNGSLVSVQGGSSLTLNGGVFANVGSGSLFSLTNGALVDFGTGNNVVNVSNDLCAGGGCFSPFANPAYQVAGSPSDFSVAPGFEPVLDVGTFQDGSVNELNLGPNSAILAVEPGGSIQLQ